MQTFKTSRLIIRPYQSTDSYAVWQVISQKAIYDTTYAIPHPFPRESVNWWLSNIKSRTLNGTGLEYGLFHKDTGEYVGNTGLININHGQRSCSLSYFVNPKFWDMGYCTEAGIEMLKLGFNRLHMKRISGWCMSKNIASSKVMKKLGFTYEGTGRLEIYKDGEFLDTNHYSILDTEFYKKYV
ncbi:MAG TPA: GNAT family N-acetyltransferase [Clostridiales bacterium]|nr:GNAT family N-acetyltransferase [Clostridiales bacterium]